MPHLLRELVQLAREHGVRSKDGKNIESLTFTFDMTLDANTNFSSSSMILHTLRIGFAQIAVFEHWTADLRKAFLQVHHHHLMASIVLSVCRSWCC